LRAGAGVLGTAVAWLLLATMGADVLSAVWPRFADPRGDHPPFSRLKIEVQPRGAEVLYGGQLELRATTSGRPVDKLWLVARAGTNVNRSLMFLAPDRTFFLNLASLREPVDYFITDGAARSHRFQISLRYAPQKTIADVFTEVGKNRADYGVVPVENSTEGVVTHTLDMFVDSELKIVAQIVLPIQHCLLSKSRREKINKLFTHPQALAQCRVWVQNRLPHAEIVETSSNARSAQLAATEQNSAAIAGALAGERYGLHILEADLQDNSANVTRFLVLGRHCSPPTGKDRTSVMFSIAHEVGALHRALAAFRQHRLNMTKIESRPSKKRAWEYYFFVDCDGHINDRSVAKAIERLEAQCNFVKVLGSYPNTE